MTVRLYGRAVGHGSLSVVTAGFREAFEGAGLLEGFVALDKSGGDEEQDAAPGALARDGVFTGNLNMVPTMRRGARHERHWVQVTPNSTHVPRNLLAAILDLPNPRILSASNWGTEIIAHELYRMGAIGSVGNLLSETGLMDSKALAPITATGTGRRLQWEHLEIHTMGHGVSGFAPVPAELALARADFAKGDFRVIHFSTTDGERKGTLELVQAWQLLEKMLPGRPELLLVLDHHANAALQQRMRDLAIEMPSTVRVLPRGDMDSATMSRVLCHMHLVAAPSRGEGFGLIPLSALACGVPVAATLTTGHSAGHLPPEHVTRIRQREDLEPIDDGPGATALPLYPADIAESIAFVYDHWTTLSLLAESRAPDVAREWSWKAQLAPLVELLR